MFRAAAYGLALLYAFVNVPMDQQACKAQFLLVLACLDSLLLFGHLWDRVPSLQVCVCLMHASMSPTARCLTMV